MIEPGVVLIAIGGNALVRDGESGSVRRQQERSAAFARQVVDLVEAGWRVLVTHGNGPQVGFILRRGELVAAEAVVEGLPELPLWLAVADSQGGIGHLLCLAIDDALIAHDRPERAVAVLTHVEVDADDPAFGCPTKPMWWSAHRGPGAAAGGRGGLVGRRDRAGRVPPRRRESGADGDLEVGAGAHASPTRARS